MMDMASYNCNDHDCDGDMTMEPKRCNAPAAAMDGAELAANGGGGRRLQYWTPPPPGKNANSLMYGDDMLLPEAGALHGGDVRSCWRDLTGASRTSSGTKPFAHRGGGLGHRQQQARATVEERVGGDGKDGEETGHGGWEEVVTSEGKEIHHAHYDVQKEELRMNPNHGDHTNVHQMQSCQDLEALGIDIRCMSHHNINNMDVELEKSKGSRDHATYGECQKNQFVDHGGKDGKLAFTCAACGCHRNFHQRIVLFDGEEQELPIPAKREKEQGGANYYTTISTIDRVAHELMSAANGAIALAQESLCYNEGRGREFPIEEQHVIAKISLENLDHIAKVINSTTECLTLLRKPSMFRKDSKSECPHEGPSSSDASPVVTVEKRAAQSLGTPPSPPRPYGAVGGQPLKHSVTLFSDACAMLNCGSAPRKPLERSTQKTKRTRTRISMEQREKLNAFAEKVGWTVVGQRKETIDAACQYIGIEPKTLKYWIHNSKQKWKRQPSQSDDTSK